MHSIYLWSDQIKKVTLITLIADQPISEICHFWTAKQLTHSLCKTWVHYFIYSVIWSQQNLNITIHFKQIRTFIKHMVKIFLLSSSDKRAVDWHPNKWLWRRLLLSEHLSQNFMVANMYMLRLHVKVLSSSYLCFTIMPNELKKGFHELPSRVPTVSRGDGFVI